MDLQGTLHLSAPEKLFVLNIYDCLQKTPCAWSGSEWAEGRRKCFTAPLFLADGGVLLLDYF